MTDPYLWPDDPAANDASAHSSSLDQLQVGHGQSPPKFHPNQASANLTQSLQAPTYDFEPALSVGLRAPMRGVFPMLPYDPIPPHSLPEFAHDHNTAPFPNESYTWSTEHYDHGAACAPLVTSLSQTGEERRSENSGLNEAQCANQSTAGWHQEEYFVENDAMNTRDAPFESYGKQRRDTMSLMDDCARDAVYSSAPVQDTGCEQEFHDEMTNTHDRSLKTKGVKTLNFGLDEAWPNLLASNNQAFLLNNLQAGQPHKIVEGSGHENFGTISSESDPLPFDHATLHAMTSTDSPYYSDAAQLLTSGNAVDPEASLSRHNSLTTTPIDNDFHSLMSRSHSLPVLQNPHYDPLPPHGLPFQHAPFRSSPSPLSMLSGLLGAGQTAQSVGRYAMVSPLGFDIFGNSPISNNFASLNNKSSKEANDGKMSNDDQKQKVEEGLVSASLSDYLDKLKQSHPTNMPDATGVRDATSSLPSIDSFLTLVMNPNHRPFDHAQLPCSNQWNLAGSSRLGTELLTPPESPSCPDAGRHQQRHALPDGKAIGSEEMQAYYHSADMRSHDKNDALPQKRRAFGLGSYPPPSLSGIAHKLAKPPILPHQTQRNAHLLSAFPHHNSGSLLNYAQQFVARESDVNTRAWGDKLPNFVDQGGLPAPSVAKSLSSPGVLSARYVPQASSASPMRLIKPTSARTCLTKNPKKPSDSGSGEPGQHRYFICTQPGCNKLFQKLCGLKSHLKSHALNAGKEAALMMGADAEKIGSGDGVHVKQGDALLHEKQSSNFNNLTQLTSNQMASTNVGRSGPAGAFLSPMSACASIDQHSPAASPFVGATALGPALIHQVKEEFGHEAVAGLENARSNAPLPHTHPEPTSRLLITDVRSRSKPSEAYLTITTSDTSTLPSTLAKQGHTCDVCLKTFMRRQDLRRHYGTHAEKKRFSCEICHTAFSRSDAKFRHVQSKRCKRFQTSPTD